MIDPTGPQLKPLAKILHVANKRGILPTIDQVAPKTTISLWINFNQTLWCEITTSGNINWPREL